MKEGWIKKLIAIVIVTALLFCDRSFVLATEIISDGGVENDVILGYEAPMEIAGSVQSAPAQSRIVFYQDIQGISFRDMQDNGLTILNVENGSNYSFKVNKEASYKDSNVLVYAQAGTSNPVEIEADSNGIYTLFDIQAEHKITLRSEDRVDIRIPSSGVSISEIEVVDSAGNPLSPDTAKVKEVFFDEAGVKSYHVTTGAFLKISLRLEEGYLASELFVTQKSVKLPSSKISEEEYSFQTRGGISGRTELVIGGVRADEKEKEEQESALDDERTEDKVPDDKLLDDEVPIGIVKEFYAVRLPKVLGVKMTQLDGNDSSKVEKGNSFQFKAELERDYNQSPMVIRVDGKELKANSDGVYTIAKIDSNKEVAISNVRKNIVIEVTKSKIKIGEVISVKLRNVPAGFQVTLHNDTPTRGVLNSKNKLRGTKEGKIKLIAIATKGKEKYYVNKSVMVEGQLKNAKVGGFSSKGIIYKVTKKATKYKSGQVEVHDNRFNDKLPKDVVIPSHVYRKGLKYKVVAISNSAFMGIKSINSVSIPKTVKKIANNAFVSCRNLEDFYVHKDNRHYRGEEDKLLSKNKKVLVAYPSAIGEVKIGGKIRVIGAYAMSGTRITKLVIGKKVKSIEVCAFSHTSSLRSIYIHSKDATTIECGCAFDKVYSAARVYVPEKSYEAYKEVLTNRHGTPTLRIRNL